MDRSTQNQPTRQARNPQKPRAVRLPKSLTPVETFDAARSSLQALAPPHPLKSS